MTRRKTFRVRSLLDSVNYSLACSTCESAVRRGMASVLETVLLEANVYAGYRYLEQHEVPKGQLPGIVREADGNCEFPDPTRRHFYTHIALRD